MKPFTLRDLEAIRLLAMRRNFRAAAHELGVSAPTLSQMIASIEQRTGIRLFNRTTRSVAPTEAGEKLIERLGPALTGITEAFDILEGFRTVPAGRIRLNASEVAAARLLPMICDFMEKHGDISIDLVSDGLLSDIVAEGFDAGVRLAEFVPQEMVAIPIGGDESLVAVASPAYLSGRSVPLHPSDLREHDCIVVRLPSGRAMDWEFEREGNAFTVDVSGRLQVGSVALALDAAIRGRGVAYVSGAEARAAIAHGALVHMLPDWTPAFEGLRLYYPRQRHHSLAFRVFLDYVRAQHTII